MTLRKLITPDGIVGTVAAVPPAAAEPPAPPLDPWPEAAPVARAPSRLWSSAWFIVIKFKRTETIRKAVEDTAGPLIDEITPE